MNPDAPPGFEKLREGFGFADVLQPLYRRAGDTPAMGMYVRERHINTLGICHGGVLMTLADIVASLSVWRARGRRESGPFFRHFSLRSPTMRLNMAKKRTRFPDRLATNP